MDITETLTVLGYLGNYNYMMLHMYDSNLLPWTLFIYIPFSFLPIDPW